MPRIIGNPHYPQPINWYFGTVCAVELRQPVWFPLQNRLMVKLGQDLFYSPPGTTLYNIQFAGGGIQTHVTARAFAELHPEQIAWVWMVDKKRYATPEEIQQLCASH